MASKAPAPEEHSGVVGGSSAEKRMACPASYQLEQKLPASAKSTSSSFAEEGDALHEAMAHILVNNVIDLDTLEGETFGTAKGGVGYVMTRELLETFIMPCMDFFDALDAESDEEGGLQFLVEKRCVMPGIPKAFGTSDLIGRTDRRSAIVDWKGGVGVLVRAFYLAEEEPAFHIGTDKDGKFIVPNAQLMYYGRAAMHTHPEMFDIDPDWPVDLYIVQPRARDGDPDEPFSKLTVTVRQLEQFRMALVARVAEAMGSEPRMRKGHHCRFAPCKVICPLHTGAMIDMAKLAPVLEKKRGGALAEDIDWGVMYGELLDFKELVEAICGEIATQAHSFMEQGGEVEGWKLVGKRPSLKYTDEPGAVALATKTYSIPAKDLVTVPETISPAQLRDKIAAVIPGGTKKARDEAAKEAIKPFTANVSSGTTVARDGDARREFIPIASNVARLSAKLAALTKQ